MKYLAQISNELREEIDRKKELERVTQENASLKQQLVDSTQKIANIEGKAAQDIALIDERFAQLNVAIRDEEQTKKTSFRKLERLKCSSPSSPSRALAPRSKLALER